MGDSTKTIGSANWTERVVPAVRRVLDRPLSGAVCFTSWVVATGLYFGRVSLLGGPTRNDANESIYDTWAIAHGRFSCAYPPVTSITSRFYPDYQPGPHVAPLWPLVSGVLAALTRIGHAVPFPSSAAMGPGCDTAYLAMYHWAGESLAYLPTIGLGYAAWFAVLAGVVALLRASGRGRRGWEALGVVLVAIAPSVGSPLLDEYHPQDLLAIGLVLGAMACVLRRSWPWAGVLLGLAVTSQQFSLLVLVPLLVVVPSAARAKVSVAAAATWAVVALPMVALTSGRAAGAVVLGTGDAGTLGGTILWETHLRGAALIFVSRIAPLVAAAALAWWARRHLGAGALDPVPFVALLATCLSLRLVFEQGLFGYKFMALSLMLVLLALVRGRVDAWLVVWLLLVRLVFNPVPIGLAVNARPWGAEVVTAYQSVCIAVFLAWVLWDAAHRRMRWYVMAALVLSLVVFGHWPPVSDTLRAAPPLWFGQLVLLVPGVAMAVAPLRAHGHGRTSEEWDPSPAAVPEPAAVPSPAAVPQPAG